MKEIVAAVKHMHASKVRGLDGFRAAFFKRYWNVVGDDILSLALRILNEGGSLFDINHTSIVLIPKLRIRSV